MDYITNTTKEKLDLKDIEAICNITFEKLKIKNPLLTITIVDNEYIKELNTKYRGKDSATDVLSFAFEEVGLIKYESVRVLGEIYISIDKAKEQAVDYNHSLKRELCYLTVHGLLHLLGYNHEIESDKKEMRKLEESVLEAYDVKR